MPTLTIRNLSIRVVSRLKAAAKGNGISMEQEVRDLLEHRYGSREKVLEQIKLRWASLPETTAGEIDEWRDANRK